MTSTKTTLAVTLMASKATHAVLVAKSWLRLSSGLPLS